MGSNLRALAVPVGGGLGTRCLVLVVASWPTRAVLFISWLPSWCTPLDQWALLMRTATTTCRSTTGGVGEPHVSRPNLCRKTWLESVSIALQISHESRLHRASEMIQLQATRTRSAGLQDGAASPRRQTCPLTVQEGGAPLLAVRWTPYDHAGRRLMGTLPLVAPVLLGGLLRCLRVAGLLHRRLRHHPWGCRAPVSWPCTPCRRPSLRRADSRRSSSYLARGSSRKLRWSCHARSSRS